jgi:hypothetical protein
MTTNACRVAVKGRILPVQWGFRLIPEFEAALWEVADELADDYQAPMDAWDDERDFEQAEEDDSEGFNVEEPEPEESEPDLEQEWADADSYFWCYACQSSVSVRESDWHDCTGSSDSESSKENG